MKKIIITIALSLMIPITTFAATVPWNRVGNSISPLDLNWGVGIGIATTSYLLDVRDGNDIANNVYLIVDNPNNVVGMHGTGGILLNPNNGGFVGINTAVPQSTLDIVNSGGTNSILRVDNADNFVGLGLVASNADDEFEGIRVGFPVSASYPYIKIGSPGYTGNGTLLTVDDYNAKFTFMNGNVGIGSTSPVAKLHITGTAGSSDIFAISSSTNARLLTVTAAGKVGIGVTAPTYDLDVRGLASAYIQARSSNANSTAGIILQNDARFWSLETYGGVSTDDFRIYDQTAGANRFNIVGGTGNVGIGTTSPSAKLSVTGTAGTGDIFAIASSTNSRLITVTNKGYLGLGTSNPGSLFTINGDDNKDSGPILNISGNAANQFESGRVRFTETTIASSPFYQGGYFHYDGSGNVFNIGVHNTADALQASDYNAISIERSTGDIGIGTNTPGAKFQIQNGDLYIASSTRGIIMPDSVDGGCRRMTLASGAWVFSATSTCP